MHWRILFAGVALVVGLIGCSNTSNDSEEPVTSIGDSSKNTTRDSFRDQPQGVITNFRMGPLIDAGGLSLILEDPSVRILDMGPEKEAYDEGHIPGAAFVHWVDDITDTERTERYNVISREEMEALMSRLGIEKYTRVILYDDMSSRISTRMYWTLKYFGHDNVQVLDGGRSVWVARGFECNADVPEVEPTEYRIETIREAFATDLAFISNHLSDPKVKLIDGRPVAQFTGEEPGAVFHTGTEHEKKGHIPGAVNVFWKDNFNDDGTFKTPDELKALYENAGVLPDQIVITYCNEGLHAAPPWFVLTEMLGYDDVRVYDDSMSEWANSEQETVVEEAGK